MGTSNSVYFKFKTYCSVIFGPSVSIKNHLTPNQLKSPQKTLTYPAVKKIINKTGFFAKNCLLSGSFISMTDCNIVL